jgi:serine/threonine protein kinase/formylglycine-generating enzyme required for sulfatase activity
VARIIEPPRLSTDPSGEPLVDDRSEPAAPKDPRIEAALCDYLERLDRGERVDRAEFLARNAPIAEELRSFIAAEDELRELAGAEIPLDRADESTKSFVRHGQETIAPQLAAKGDSDSDGSGLTGQFGRYRIIRPLGKGAMGTVYLAEDTQLRRQVALKTPHFTEDPTGERLERFFREARAAGNLRNPNICLIHDFGQIDGKHYISMAYIEGHPLSAFIRPNKPQSERQILIVIRKLALALQEAHDHEIVHRDLKPANIMINKKGEPIIMDFGLAQQMRPDEDVRLTQTGNILGTPAFMSPEQVQAEPDKIGPLTDQYSLGVILYELLTAQLPFRGSVIAVMGQILTKEPPRPSQLRPDLDPRIEAVCLRMMAKNPLERFASTKAVADELATILKSPAARSISKEQPGHFPARSQGAPPAADRERADIGASQVLKSLKQKATPERDLPSLEELARKCYSRRDYDRVIQTIERIPEEHRTEALKELLEQARENVDEIAFLICEIDDAERAHDSAAALRKAGELLKLKPGHPRARQIQAKFSGDEEEETTPKIPLRQATQPRNKGRGIRWGVAAFGSIVIGVMFFHYRGSPNVFEPREDAANVGSKPNVDPVKNETFPKHTRPHLLVAPFDESAAKQGQHQWADFLNLPVEVSNAIGMKLVLIPPGEFDMGSADSRLSPNARPIHHVRITKPFYLGAYEVTQEEYMRVMGSNPSGHRDDPRLPVEALTYAEGLEFSRRLTAMPDEKRAGRTYRNPTEAEWEYACRAGTQTLFYFGDTMKSRVANFDTTQPEPGGLKAPAPLRPMKVGSFPPNAFGLYDMLGNVMEGVSDWYSPDYYAHSPVEDPQGPSSGKIGIVRGGNFQTPPVESGHREVGERGNNYYQGVGFRVTASLTAAVPDRDH